MSNVLSVHPVDNRYTANQVGVSAAPRHESRLLVDHLIHSIALPLMGLSLSSGSSQSEQQQYLEPHHQGGAILITRRSTIFFKVFHENNVGSWYGSIVELKEAP